MNPFKAIRFLIRVAILIVMSPILICMLAAFWVFEEEDGLREIGEFIREAFSL
jgi:hypothetical protein